MAPFEKVFVVHWSPLADRRSRLSSRIENWGVPIEWVTDFDRNTLAPEKIREFYRDSVEVFHQRAALGGEWNTPIPYYPLSPGEIATAITHITILQRILDQKLHSALVVEDDVIFEDHFLESLNSCIEELPQNWDILFPGSGAGLRVPNPTPGRRVYEHPRHLTRTADLYLIRQQAAQQLLSTIVPFSLPIDWEMSFHQNLHRLRVFWCEPSIARQGSESGEFKSSLPPKT